MQQTMKSTKFLTVSTLVKISILSAIGYILMFISVPLPMLFPEFLKIDISDLTALLGGISLGPMAGVTIAFLKNLLQFITGMSTTGGVGEFANFLIGGSFVFTVSYIYSKKKYTRSYYRSCKWNGSNDSGRMCSKLFYNITFLCNNRMVNRCSSFYGSSYKPRYR